MKDVTFVGKRVKQNGNPRRALCHDNVQSNTALNKGGLAAQRTHFSRIYPVNEIRERLQRSPPLAPSKFTVA